MFYLLLLYGIFLILMPITLIALPVDLFDSGQSVCLSVLVFNENCYGCGMTRAIQHLLHFQFSEAIAFNKLSIAVFPTLSILWFLEVRRTIEFLKKNYGSVIKR
jgi:hypothetical protein